MFDSDTQQNHSGKGARTFLVLLSLLCYLAVFQRYVPGQQYKHFSAQEKNVPSTTSGPPTEIAINRESSFVDSDISRILHVPKETRIEVHLKAKSIRRCQNPVFKGRLSGWSLSLIDFNFKFNDDQPASDVIVGTYDLSQMPASGKYYVEIIVLLCEGYGKSRYNSNKPLKTSQYISSVSASKSMYRYCPGTCSRACQSPTMLWVVNCLGQRHRKGPFRSTRWFGFAQIDRTVQSCRIGIVAGGVDRRNITHHVLRCVPHHGC